MKLAILAGSILALGLTCPSASAQGMEDPPATQTVKVHPYSLKDWELTARVYAGHNDNVNFVSDGDPWFDGETDSPVIGFTAIAAYRKNIGDGFHAGASLRFDQTFHTNDQENYDPNVNDNAREYDLTALAGAAYIERAWQATDGRRAHLGASVEVTHEDAEISSIQNMAYSVHLYGEIEPTIRTAVGARLTLGSRDFEVEFGGNPEFQRDGEYYSAEINGRIDLDGRRRSVSGFIRATKNEADGVRFQYAGTAIGIRPLIQIDGPLWLSLEASGDWRDYETSTLGTPRTEATLVRTSAQLVWSIDRTWTADFEIARLDVDSNDPLYEGDRTTALFGIQGRY